MAQSPVSLPQALLNRRRKIEEESGPGPDDTGQQPPEPSNLQDPPEPLVQDPPQPPAPQKQQRQEDPPALDDDDDDDELDLTEDLDLVSALSSMTGAEDPPAATPPAPAQTEDRRELERERQRLKEEREAMDAEKIELERQRKEMAKAETPALSPGQTDPAVLKNFEKSAPAIKHYALEAAAEQINPILSDISDRLARLESTTNQVTQTAERAEAQAKTMSDRAFNAEIHRALGDIRPIFKNDRFAAFLNRRPPYMPDKTLRALLNQALEARQPAPVISIVQAFAKSEAAAGRPIETMRVGRATGGTQKRLPNKGRSGTLRWSDRQKAWNDFRSGVISRDKFNEVKTRFEEADAKGLVDYDS